MRVIKLRLRGLDRCLIRLHCGLELIALILGCVEVLLIDHLLVQQISVACERDFGVGKLRFVLRFFSDRLIQSCLERPRIDHRQEITRLYILPFGEKNFLQLTIHARVNRDGVERLHRAQAVEINRHILSLDRACDHRHLAAARAESATFSRSSCCSV